MPDFKIGELILIKGKERRENEKQSKAYFEPVFYGIAAWK